ncbi:LamG domain-containing protein [Nocardioides nematodiphilus]|uniref:LamG domain-containing protein n=1 Tax=Nocardioides nematodiphilus TaxID=2849669 RepID=UPI001CD9DCEC|nr:LamG domain-containing protein [Nocardioides nematodiphilus]MCA1983742.1 LamG domain-containing protein [Nocardioides nematodiphilus]
MQIQRHRRGSALGRVSALVVAGALGSGLTLLPAGAALAATGTSDTAPPVTSAGALIDSVGVNVHMSYSDTSYADPGKVLSLLQGLGVRHVRDMVVSSRADQVAALQRLGAAGIRSELILNGSSGIGPQLDQSQLSELAQLAPVTDAVEPTNEYDCSGDAAWPAHLHAYASRLAEALQASPATARLGLLAPAFCRPESVGQYGSAVGSASVANAHEYPADKTVELAAESRLPAWAATQGPALPQVVTETGYSDIQNSAYPARTTQAAAADNLVRSILENKRLGVVRTYLYELLDEKADSLQLDPEQHFGLVANNGALKPAYTAIQSLLRDIGRTSNASTVAPSSAPAPFAVSLSGGGSLLRSLVTTDPDGRGQTVALWLAAPTTSAASSVRVSLSSGATATAQRPSRGNAVTALGTGTSFDVPVDGAVTLVHVGPPTSATAASCVSSVGYAATASALGASVINPLAASTWSGAPAASSTLPAWLPQGGATISGGGQQVRVAVPGSPTSWTIGIWARIAPGSAEAAPFVHGTNLTGALIRTYDLTHDVPSHVQLSAYGPAAGPAPGAETYGQLVPGSWHFLALAAGPSTTTLFVDGIAAGTVASAPQALTGVDLGSLDASLGGGFRGDLAALTVFPKALPAASVLALATAADRPCEHPATRSKAPARATKHRHHKKARHHHRHQATKRR